MLNRFIAPHCRCRRRHPGCCPISCGNTSVCDPHLPAEAKAARSHHLHLVATGEKLCASGCR
jgi:hypothetical protein